MSPIKLNGSTSGFVALDAPAAAGSNTLVLPTGNGSSGQVLSTNGSGTLSWVQGGRILQVVQATYSTLTTTSSSTFADTGLTATITPSSSANKILVTVAHNGCGKYINNTYMFLRLLRGSTTIADIERTAGATGSTAQVYWGTSGITYLDSPATTSAVTYKTQFASKNNNAVIELQSGDGGINPVSTITLMEVAV